MKDQTTLENKKLSPKDIMVVGFALFAMFFGAGNVIFPPYLGIEAGPQWFTAFVAYYIADIGLALLAVFALLRVGSSDAVTQRLGKIPAAILMSAMILCIGPCVAIPRTAASTYEMAIAPNIGSISSIVFSIIFFAIVLFLCIRESAVVDVVGAILTPLLLLGLIVIIIKGCITPLGEIALEPQGDNVILGGVKAGYQTLDALAALPFGIIVVQSVIDKGYKSKSDQKKATAAASILAGVLLLIVYGGLCYLGATVSRQYGLDIARADLIMAIVQALMGKAGMIIFGVVVGLACLTTAIGLTSSAAAYFSQLSNGKLSYKLVVIIVCVFSAAASNVGLDTIISIAAPVLDIVYPPALVVILVSLIMPNISDWFSRGAAIGALLTAVLTTFGVSAMSVLPLYSMGMHWIIPAIVCGLIGLALGKGKKAAN